MPAVVSDKPYVPVPPYRGTLWPRIINWYIPRYLLKQYPQFATWKGLKGKESVFKSPESGSQGMFLGGDPVGSCGLHDRVGPDGLEIGYWVDEAQQGRGLASEAAALLTDAAFTLSRIERVVILHDETNVRSSRVPQRLGYRQVGRIDSTHDQAPEDTGRDLVWEVTRAEWGARS